MAGLNTLTASKVRGIKADRKRKVADGGGLYFVTNAKGYRGWAYIWQVARKRRERGLGPYPAISLKEAREMRDACAAAVRAGKDPRTAIQPDTGDMTFGDALTAVIHLKAGTWKNPKTRARWDRTRDVYAADIRGKPVGDVTQDDVIDVLMQPVKGGGTLWVDRHVTATHVQRHIEAALNYGILKGRRTDRNVATFKDFLERLLPLVNHKVRHHPSIPYALAPAFAARLHEKMQIELGGGTMRLTLFIMLTGCRISEARLARWRDVDLDERLWTLPIENEKVGKFRTDALVRHLSPRHIELLGASGTPDDLVFPGHKDGQPFSEAGPLIRFQRDPVAHTYVPHGCRATFKTWAVETQDASDNASEKALGHLVGDKTRRSYAREVMVKGEVELVDAWGEFLWSEIEH